MPEQYIHRPSVEATVTRTPHAIDGNVNRQEELTASHTAVVATISSPMPNTCANPSAPVRKVKFPCPLCEHVSQNEPKRITHLDHKHPDWVTESFLGRQMQSWEELHLEHVPAPSVGIVVEYHAASSQHPDQ